MRSLEILRWASAGSIIAMGACNGSPSVNTSDNGVAVAYAGGGSNNHRPKPPPGSGSGDHKTDSPIKHVVVIVGENRTFDHVFATYKAKHGQHVDNLLSRHIINEDGTAGPAFGSVVQKTAVDSAPDGFLLSPPHKAPYKVLPPALAGGPTDPFVSTIAEAQELENGLPDDYYQFLLTGGTGLASGAVDTRLPNPTTLPPGPFQLTPGIPYDAYSASPVHRFYQMWQQLDCNVQHISFSNPSGCRMDLFPWVEVTIGAGNNGATQPPDFNDMSTGEGSTAMGFYNVQKGDVPYFKYLADNYAMSDNFHQSIEGGTGANHVFLGAGDEDWFSDGEGNPQVPPALNTENPDPQAGTNNWYTQDGYSGGTYSDCADDHQPGVHAVNSYLKQIGIDPHCEKGHYYLLNNYAPGYFGDGTVNTGQFTIPPSSTRTIGDELLEQDISWRYYGDQFNRYLADPDYTNPENNYCDICNPFQYATSIMANDSVRTTHMKDTIDLYNDIDHDWLPAFSIVKPSGVVDGHPASSKLNLFEGFTKKIVDQIKSHPDLWKDTAIFITFDEGGGYYDAGYVQPLDFFGDGTRIPMIVVSPHATGGRISHDYGDHVSVLKFVERNWHLKPLTKRSRDNFPNPITRASNPYAPVNSPALGDLYDLFDFSH
ncbi:MAG TPA: alkaline phosphatase family protein [Polyangia bacterium]|nr:alkaline phosphatase family protein [Polyangia bacterium]